MNKKVVSLAFRLWLVSAVLSLFVVGLLELQMAYASPYTSINVNTAYDMITNGSYPNLVVLDVRTKSEYDSGHIYDTVWIPVSELEARIGELAGHENHETIVYCLCGCGGGRSETASEILDSYNFTKVYNMAGGIEAWQSFGYPVWIATVHNINTTFNYDTIQAALDTPQTLDGHTILVDGGTYYEHVIVNKTVTLIGENRSTTIIDGNGTGTIIRSNASNVEIRGFTIQNGGDTPNSGIFIRRGVNNTICDSIIRNSAYGIELLESSSSSIIGNTMMNNSWAGIYIHDSNENIIHGNTVANNSIGAWVASSDIPNTFYHNNFIDNPSQASDFGPSNWDNGTEGNFWSDYTGKDLDSDGIGDTNTPHLGLDYYPLMHPYGSIRNLNTYLAYLTIQSAINAPQTLDTHAILLSSGTYSEHAVVNKSVSLIGENRINTIINGSNTGHIISIEANNVTVSEFTIENGGGLPYANVYLEYSNYSKIINNVFTRDGLHDGYGVRLNFSSFNTISGNNITNNDCGVFLEYSSNNSIYENDIANNNESIYLQSSSNNSIYLNKFVDNAEEVYSSESTNTWDNGREEGNYWSDYNGTDTNGDGIGDTYLPWQGVDNYPLMSPYIEGDVNHDAVVDIVDLSIVSLALWSEPGDTKWNPHADPNGDNLVDIVDLTIVAIHLWETW